MKTFQDEENILLDNFLGIFLTKGMEDVEGRKLKDYIPVKEASVEFIFSPRCSQKCEYCYIYQHGNELYPVQPDRETLLKNLDMALDLIYCQKKLFPYVYDIFAGDMFMDDIFFDMMDMFEKYFNRLGETIPELFRTGFAGGRTDPVEIMMPSNLAFVYYNPEKAERVREYVKRFREMYNININFSWSSDGLYCTEYREKKELGQEYFDAIFKFCDDISAGFHPMVSPENVKYWVENYDWWLEQYRKLKHFDIYDFFQPMMLEVRNDNWTDENIDDYLKFLDHVMDVRYHMRHESREDLAYSLYGYIEKGKVKLGRQGYDPIRLDYQGGKDGISCSISTTFGINLNNMSLPMCHRLTYPQLIGGYLDTDGEKITGLTANNASAYIALKTSYAENLPKCNRCAYNKFCIKGCLGAQFEHHGEPFIPIPSVCHFFDRKIRHLCSLYKQYGLWDIILQDDFPMDDGQKTALKRLKAFWEADDHE